MLKILEKQTYISLLLELISNWIDMCLGIRKPEAMAINAFSLEQQQSLEKLWLIAVRVIILQKTICTLQVL